MLIEFVAHFELEFSYPVGRALVRIDGDGCPPTPRSYGIKKSREWESVMPLSFHGTA